jgi:hypothetical protein
MATPASGQISFADLNTEILQATGSTQLNMNDAGVRCGFGATSQLSLSQLYKAWGCTITEGTYTDKFGTNYGYNNYLYTYGSTNDSSITSSTNLMAAAYGTLGGTTDVSWWAGPLGSGGPAAYQTGYRYNNLSRLAFGGTSVSFTTQDGQPGTVPDGASVSGSYFDGSGTTTVGMIFQGV